MISYESCEKLRNGAQQVSVCEALLAEHTCAQEYRQQDAMLHRQRRVLKRALVPRPSG